MPPRGSLQVRGLHGSRGLAHGLPRRLQARSLPRRGRLLILLVARILRRRRQLITAVAAIIREAVTIVGGAAAAVAAVRGVAVAVAVAVIVRDQVRLQALWQQHVEIPKRLRLLEQMRRVLRRDDTWRTCACTHV